jgi:microcystin-dependent protein
LSESFIGQIRLFSFNFNPKGWALCNGQTLAINQNAALFSILGTTYGGNGVSTFQLPNLQARTPAYGISTLGPLGAITGAETVALSTAQMPQHTHTLNGLNTAGTAAHPNGNMLANISNAYDHYAPATAGTLVALSQSGPNSLSTVGTGATHNNLQPFLVLNYCICMTGIFPSRN